jgi:peroxiredoxin
MSQGTETQAPEAPAEALPQATTPVEARPSGRPAQAGPPGGHGHLAPEKIEATLVLEAGYHVMHLFFKLNRGALSHKSKGERRKAIKQLTQILDKASHPKIEQFQCFGVPGHKADFGLIMAGTDLRAIHDAQVAVQASLLGQSLSMPYSFYSITEISEYVPSVEDYGKILRDREGIDPETPSYKAKVAAYEGRLGPMNKQRITPEFPDWPCLCFYPMSKMREGDQNWYTQPFEVRSELMSQHGKSGMKFAGKVSQIITASTGLDDWEWGVTLWAKNPAYLKDIVYTMRFDESSARYALFGDFYFGFILPPAELLDSLKI